jgi:hypothetical protein
MFLKPWTPRPPAKLNGFGTPISLIRRRTVRFFFRVGFHTEIICEPVLWRQDHPQ